MDVGLVEAMTDVFFLVNIVMKYSLTFMKRACPNDDCDHQRCYVNKLVFPYMIDSLR